MGMIVEIGVLAPPRRIYFIVKRSTVMCARGQRECVLEYKTNWLLK